MSEDPLAVLEEAETHQKVKGHGGDVFVSCEAGFVPIDPPHAELPRSHAAWDQLIGQLPVLVRDETLPRAVDELPVLGAGTEDLPDSSLARAASVLAHMAHAWVRIHHETFPELPLPISRPWTTVTERLGREQRFLSFTDVIAYNWRLRDPDGPRIVENMDLLIPVAGNQAERISQLTMTESLARSGPVVRAVVEVAQGVRADDAERVHSGLAAIRDALQSLTYETFLKMDPNPWSPTATDPLVWGKLVAPFGAPIYEGEPGFSGTAAPTFQLLDGFFGRSRYESVIGRETLHQRAVLPPLYRRLIEAVAAVPVREWVLKRDDPELRGVYQQTLEAYAGDRGWLGVHRLKLYGYTELAFKAGREASNGGLASNVSTRAWEEVYDHADAARRERLKGWSVPASQVWRRRVEKTFEGDSSLCRHVQLDLQGSGLRYQAGDRVAVLIRHRRELVERTLEAFRASAEAPVKLTKVWREHVALRGLGADVESLPLRDFLEIARLRPVQRSTVKALHRLTLAPQLHRLLEVRQEDQLELWMLLELVRRAANYDVKRMVAAEPWEEENLARLVPPEPWRLYSISSAPAASTTGHGVPNSLSMTIGELRYQAKADVLEQPFDVRGGASSFLVRPVEDGGDPVAIRIHRPSRFELPKDDTVPVVMFAGGTGISPMMAFIRQRALDGARGRTVLFLGTRTRKTFYYEDELRRRAEAGELEIHLAMSDEDTRLVVENGESRYENAPARLLPELMKEPEVAAQLVELMSDRQTGGQGGQAYICGQSGLAEAVIRTLEGVFADHALASRSQAEAKAFAAETVYRMTAQGRLMLDVFTTFKPEMGAGTLGAGTYDMSEVVQHNVPGESLWIVIRGQVYDVTRFAQLHPGGNTILISNAGLDATRSYEKIEHHLQSEVHSQLDMYKIGAVRRLGLGSQWGCALLPEGMKVFSLQDVYREWARYVYRIVETENILHNELSIQTMALTSAEEPTDRTPMKLRLFLEAHRRLIFGVLDDLLGDALSRLWYVTTGLFARSRPLNAIAAQVEAVQSSAAAEAAGAFTEALLASLRTDPGAFSKVEAACETLAVEDRHVLSRLKDVAREALRTFETHESATLAEGGATLTRALERIPGVVAQFHARLADVSSAGS